ncbi:DUF4494 domain-containing protein [Prolixibacteraceae bacterium JC049]|nr:DUF4494 domain-containing protein [Prolixibacteraceae bacterium JC049]
MNIWFECKAKYEKIDEEGRLKKVNEAYLLDAMSFTEAESRIYKELETMISGEFLVTKIAKTNITEVIPSETGDRWFKCKLALVTIDESSGKEKKANQYVLVLASDVKDAYDKVEKNMDGVSIDYEIPSVQESPILDVFPYEVGEKVPENFTPVAETVNEEEYASEPTVYDASEEEEAEAAEETEE